MKVSTKKGLHLIAKIPSEISKKNNNKKEPWKKHSICTTKESLLEEGNGKKGETL